MVKVRNNISRVDKIFYRIDRENIWKDQDYKCFYCQEALKRTELTMDHVVPISKVGGHSTANCVVSCLECNQKKSNKPVDPWTIKLKEMGERIEERTRLALWRLSMSPKGSYKKWKKFHYGKKK